MNFSAGLFSDYIHWIAHPAYLIIMGFALYTAPWKRLTQGEQLHVFLGTTVVLLLLWSMKAGISPGLDYHLLGGTLLTLMFGWQLALVAVSLVIAGVTLNGSGDLYSFSLNVLLMGVLPILFSYAVFRFSVRRLPHHFFVYVLVDGYLCAGVAMALTVAAAAVLLACCGSYSMSELTHHYLPFAPFMIFAEAFFTGMLAASMALMRPEWIWSFDDRRYLAGK